MNDDRLYELLRAAMPPASEGEPEGDVWAQVVERMNRRARWSAFDIGLAVAATAALFMFPEWIPLLAYHL
jgi:hypothetical protein